MIVVPSILGAETEGLQVQGQPGNLDCLKIKEGLEMQLSVRALAQLHEALDSNPSNASQKKKKKNDAGNYNHLIILNISFMCRQQNHNQVC